ncbi:hypothetical protein TNCV_3382411 [Trichonephila clavipes]|nr:hypothetical protein TNCV_3382411 [Trichonephila clavipes]
MGSMCAICMHVGQWCVFVESRKLASSAVYERVWTTTSDMWRERGTLEITLYSFRKDYITDQVVGWYELESAYVDALTCISYNLTSQRYANKILTPHVVLYAVAIGDFILLMQEIIQLIWWRFFLKLKQYGLWSCQHVSLSYPTCLGLIRKTHSTLPSLTVPVVEISLLEDWKSIPQSLNRNFIASMLNRCASALAVRGDHTPY